MICLTSCPVGLFAVAVFFQVLGFLKAQEHLASGVGVSNCLSRKAAGQRHSDKLLCTFPSAVTNFHVYFYLNGTLNIPDIVISCTSSCQVRAGFEEYIFVSPSDLTSSQKNTYTFEVLPSNTTKGSYMCSGFHGNQTLSTNFCNVSDYVIGTDPLPLTSSGEATDGGNKNNLHLLFLLLFVPATVVVFLG